jgi:hypothetical protein
MCVCVFSGVTDVLAAMLTTLSTALPAIEAVVLSISDALARMQLRASHGVSRAVEACDMLLASLNRAQARMKQAARALYHQIGSKMLVELHEEADSNARLLDAVVPMRDVRRLPVLGCSCVMWPLCRLLSCCVAMASVLC